MILQSTSLTSLHQSSNAISEFYITNNLKLTCTFLGKSLIPGPKTTRLCLDGKKPLNKKATFVTFPCYIRVNASFIQTPVLWAGRVCIFYALLKAGLAGSPSSPFLQDMETGVDDLGFSKWIEEFQTKPEKDATDKRKLVSKWHPTTKGTLRRNYRIQSKSEGIRLLKSIASLLSEDDQFRDVTSHKGCQIRRESAHGESVCCNNVRALFDELPTPHLIVEITPFPKGPLTEKDYEKAQKLERVLKSGPSV